MLRLTARLAVSFVVITTAAATTLERARPRTFALVAALLAMTFATGVAGHSAHPAHASVQAARPMTANGDGHSRDSWRPGMRVSPIRVERMVIPLGRRAIAVPILEYHYIRVNPYPNDRLGFNLSVTPLDFQAQMTWLDTHGYHPVTFDDLRAYFAGKAPLPDRPVVLTFDDGYLDFLTAAEPVLQAHGFEAVAYIVPGFWGRKSYMSAAEVKALDRSGLVEIASHTMDHVDLSASTPAERAYELDRSRQALEKLLGHPVLDFCYPVGAFGNGAVGAVGAAGYATATTETPGSELSWPARLMWPRIRVNGGETLDAFIAGLGAPEAAVMQKVAA